MSKSTVKILNEVIDVPVNSIVPYWNNPRINDKTKEALVAVYEKIGFNQPIVVDKEYVIVKGHARYYATVMAGLKTIPVLITDNNEELNKEDRLLDNQIQELSGWDFTKLENIMRTIDMEIPHVNEKIDTPEMITAKDLTEHIHVGAKAVEKKSGDELAFFLVCPVCGEEINIFKSELAKMEIVEDEY